MSSTGRMRPGGQVDEQAAYTLPSETLLFRNQTELPTMRPTAGPIWFVDAVPRKGSSDRSPRSQLRDCAACFSLAFLF
jgi:hypothetical protein